MARPSLAPLPGKRWGLNTATHLLRRAGFGLPRDLALKLAEMAPEEAVAYVVDYDVHPSLEERPAFVEPPEPFAARRKRLSGLTDVERQLAIQEERREERAQVAQLQAWWLERMHTTPRPLEEKMTLFWHGHFATSAQKVRSPWHTWHLNHIMRLHATGNFRDLVINVGKSPSMLHYLDNRRSRKENPNENWARELMELFTMGVGNYTEDDIKAAARAFTGWSNDQKRFVYREEWHDKGQKTFLGHTGNFTGWDIVDIILEQPATSRFLAKKLWHYFASEEAPQPVVEELAKVLRDHKFAIAPALRALFLSNAFYANGVAGAQIKSPAQFVVQLADDLGLSKPPYTAMARASASLGQNLFYPPNVKGWDGNRAWINANTLLQRFNMPPQLTLAALDENLDPEERQQRMRVAQEQVRMTMRALPPKERQQQMGALRKGNMAERIDMLSTMGVEVPLPEEADPAAVFDHLVFLDAKGCVDALEDRFLATPLDKAQRAVLIDALTEGQGPATAMQPDTIAGVRRRAALRLLFSTAEYQLC